jgi:spermidine synthase
VQRRLTRRAAQVFVGGTVSYAFTTIPTYPSGQIGFMLCSKQGDTAEFVTPQRAPPAGGSRPLRYYNPQVHAAAFALPEFARSALAGSLTTASAPAAV